jgi:hypothetical protein
MPQDRHKYLIVCGDDRAIELARVLAPDSDVYLCEREEDGRAQFYILQQQWVLIADPPLRFDALFFHTGNTDPAGIPDGCEFIKKFAFSGGGLSGKEEVVIDEGAISIRRRFVSGCCPVQPWHLAGLAAFVDGSRPELPAFCQPEERPAAIQAVIILCQAYTAAGIANGIPAVNALAGEIGWPRLDRAIAARLLERVGKAWPAVQTAGWWRTALGVGTDMVVSEVFSRVIGAPELDLDKRSDFGALVHFIERAGIEELLQPDVVERAYRAARAFLETQ